MHLCDQHSEIIFAGDGVILRPKSECIDLLAVTFLVVVVVLFEHDDKVITTLVQQRY